MINPISSSLPVVRSTGGVATWLLSGLGVAILTVWFFSPARQIANPQLDPSNYASYAYYTAQDFQYGPEVVPMAGPYGFVPYGFLYAGQLFWKRLPLELLTKAVLAGLVVWFFRRASGRPGWRMTWLATLLVFTPLLADLPYDLAVLLTGLCLVEHHFVAGRRSLLLVCGLAAYLALLTLFKGTQTSLALATLGLLGLQAWHQSDFRRLPWIIGSYLATLTVLLLAAGQNPLNLPLYLRGVWELSYGYNAAMGLDEPRSAFVTGVGALLALELLLLVLLLARWRQPAALAGGLLLAGFTFVKWKHGFVRADGHVFIFYQYVCVAAPTVLLFLEDKDLATRTRWRVLLVRGLVLLALSLGLWGDGAHVLPRHAWVLRQLPGHFGGAARQIMAPAGEKSRLDTALAAHRSTFDLPMVRNTIGAGSVDFFGTEFGYLMLNRFNYRPRPMGGGTFNVFTAWLQDRNSAYLADPDTRPDYYLVSPQTIDQRFLAQDDPGTLRALLELYTPVVSEQGLVLFRARSGATPLPTPRFLGSQPLVLGQPVTTPAVATNEMLLVSFSLPLSLPGRLRAMLYKPPLIFMDLTGVGITHHIARRVVPNLFRNPVPLDPVLEDMTDLLTLYQGVRGKTMRQFTLHTPQPGLWASGELQANFYAAPRPAPEPAVAASLIDVLRFPTANVSPLLLEPSNAALRNLDGLPVQMLDPPGRIRFALSGRENELQFKFGLDPESYLRGRTDGVDFLVELERPGQPAQILYRRWLRPATEPADRGLHSQRVVLPPYPPGSTLALRTDPGADRDGGWDWAYLTGIRLLGRGYLPEQFPGFARLPIEVDATAAGMLKIEGRELFMLNAPGALTFALSGTEKTFTFTGGLLAGAYTNGGQSDGVEFLVDLRTPDGAVTRIARLWLNPRDHESDRGDRSYNVALPATAPNTQLILKITPGPLGNGAWDWSYVASLEIH